MSCFTGQTLVFLTQAEMKHISIKHDNPFKSSSNGPTERRRAIIIQKELLTLK
jgi:hypothetical protein